MPRKNIDKQISVKNISNVIIRLFFTGERRWTTEQHWPSEPDASLARRDGVPEECK